MEQRRLEEEMEKERRQMERDAQKGDSDAS